MFLCLEGLDGTGKSTQCRLLAEWLRGRGREVVTCRDPGGTPVGDLLRGLVLERHRKLTPAAEAFLFMASRAELVARVIRPALDAGSVVVCDRFLLSNVVYQGHAGGIEPAEIWRMGLLATGGLEPDRYLILDLPVEAAEARRRREPDRMEDRGPDFHARVRAGFLAEAARRPERFRVIDATADAAAVQQAIRAAIAPDGG